MGLMSDKMSDVVGQLELFNHNMPTNIESFQVHGVESATVLNRL